MTDGFIHTDGEIFEVLFSPVCLKCVHLINFGKRTCVAFPTGIPYVIWSGEDKHRKPYFGDHGIQYKPKGGNNPKFPEKL